MSDASRESLVYAARIYENSERYTEMLDLVELFINKDPELIEEEVRLVSVCFKNCMHAKRNSLRILQQIQAKELRLKKELHVSYIQTEIDLLTADITDFCNRIKDIIDSQLLPKADNFDNKAIFNKQKADVLRYMCEYLEGEELEKAQRSADLAYKKALAYSKKMPIYSSERLGIALNYAVFECEMRHNYESGIKIAQECLDEALKNMQVIDKHNSKECILIMQILKENVQFWKSEVGEIDDV